MVFNDPETISPLWQAWQQAELMVKNCGYESIYFDDIKASGDFVNRGFKTILVTDTLEEAQNLKSKFADELLKNPDYIINPKTKKRLRLLIKVSRIIGDVTLSITDIPVTRVMTKAKMPDYIKEHYKLERMTLCMSRLGGIKDKKELERQKLEIEPLLNKLSQDEKESLRLIEPLDDNVDYKVSFIKSGKSYRITWFSRDDARRRQESLGDIFIFAHEQTNEALKPKLIYRSVRKIRSDNSSFKSIIVFPFGAYVWQ